MSLALALTLSNMKSEGGPDASDVGPPHRPTTRTSEAAPFLVQ